MLTATNQWKIVVRGLDDRYHEVFIDPQGDFGHARALAMAYTVPDPDRPLFVPDARVIREGAVVGLLDALRALLKNPGPRERQDAQEAISSATDPDFDIRLQKEDQVTLETLRAVSQAGGQAYVDGLLRTDYPEIYPEGSTMATAWIKGWEAAALTIKASR